MLFSRLRYYLHSLPTLLTQIKNWYALPLLLNKWPLPLLLGKRPFLIIHLRNGLHFKVRTLMDVWIIKETCLDQDYEQHSVPIQNGWTIIDIGAGLGDFPIMVAQRHPDCRIFAFEPFPQSYQLMQENLRLNELTTVHSYQMGIGATDTPLTLQTTGAAVQHTTTTIESKTAVQQIEVPAQTLAQLFAKEGLTQCHFLKIDCEGCEFEVLFQTDSETLAKIEHICLEYHNGVTPYTAMQLGAHLEAEGFQVTLTPNPVHASLGFLYAYRGAT